MLHCTGTDHRRFCCLHHRETDKVEFKYGTTENGHFTATKDLQPAWGRGKWKLANKKITKGGTSLILKVYRNGLLIGTTNEIEALAVGSLQIKVEGGLSPGQVLCDFTKHGDDPQKWDAGSVELHKGVYIYPKAPGDVIGGPAGRMAAGKLFGKDMRGRPFLVVGESEHILLKVPEIPPGDETPQASGSAVLSIAAPVNPEAENDFTIDLTASWPTVKEATKENTPFAPLLQLHTSSDNDSAVLLSARRVGETLELKFGEDDVIQVVVRATFQRIVVVRQGASIIWRVNSNQVRHSIILLQVSCV